MTKSLSKAIALATLVGAAASAQAAMTVNPDGLGEVLLYSLYTAEEGNITNINITNTTNLAKAVKVRFVEGQNSQEVLDFNLYLSPRDQWSGAVTATAGGAMLISADKSCTVPAIPAAGVEFRDFDYKGDTGEQSLARTRVGHLEVIEMGTLEGLASSVKAGSKPGLAPANCGALTQAFGKDGVWEKDVNTGINVTSVGGLYGSASILNIDGSTQISYDAVAVNGFIGSASLHAQTGSIYPSLNGDIVAPAKPSDPSVATTSKEATFADGTTVKFDSTIQALTALLAKSEINNDFVLDEARGSQTNWVVTFPTKRFHVDATMPYGLAYQAQNAYNAAIKALQDAVDVALPADKPAAEKALKDFGTFAEYVKANKSAAPFTSLWANGQSCENVVINSWDNEEYTQANVDFSPSQPGNGPKLCYETNILSFNDAKVLGGEFVSNNINLKQPDFQFGWMNIDFSAYSLDSLAPVENVKGLPVIGFSAVTVKNNNTGNGLANNYGSSTNHKAVK